MPNDRLPDYLHFKFSTTGAKPSSETAIDTLKSKVPKWKKYIYYVKENLKV